MRVGSLVEYENPKAPRGNKGLVLKRLSGVTFDEVLVVWFSPTWILNQFITKRWETPKDLRMISR